MVNYVPDRGDIVWLQFNPQTGHEQSGKRPALTISPKQYNAKVGLAVFCPVTSNIKGYPFEVEIHAHGINGVVLADQVKSLDWKVREAKFIAKAGPEIINKTLELITLLIQ
jgi:mRNA interferase MazF